MVNIEFRDLGPAGTIADKFDHRSDRIGLPLEHRLDGAVVAVGDPAGDAERVRPAAGGVTEEDALDAAAGDDTPPDRGQ